MITYSENHPPTKALVRTNIFTDGVVSHVNEMGRWDMGGIGDILSIFFDALVCDVDLYYCIRWWKSVLVMRCDRGSFFWCDF